jgi:hypothetical protein
VGKTVPIRVMRQGKAFDTEVILQELREPKKTPRPHLPSSPLDEDDTFGR